jgi:hypothetical protein
MTRRRRRIVVLGMIGSYPFGGQTWLFLNWLRGLQRLGHDVWYVEDDVLWPYDGRTQTTTEDWTYAVDHVERCMRRIGLADQWAVRFSPVPGARWGPGGDRVDELFRQCDVLLNIVGTRLRETHLSAPLRVYVETDPVTHELRQASGDPFPEQHFAEHDVVATYGENYGAEDCGVPLNGRTFVSTRQPVDLELWPMAYTPAAISFTTIGNYRQQGKDVEYRGEVYRWSKHHEWAKFLELPQMVDQQFELAVTADHEDSVTLESYGWSVTNPLVMSMDVFGAYPDYIRRSRAEFTVAKDQNVRLRSGWFSERDACYLASGKPVVAQDTGFGNVLPTGVGLFAVTDVGEAAEAVSAVNRDYRRHCEAARAVATEYFDAERVARQLLEDVGAG